MSFISKNTREILNIAILITVGANLFFAAYSHDTHSTLGWASSAVLIMMRIDRS